MTHQDKGHFSLKHSPDRKINERVAEMVKEKVKDGTMACAIAFEIAEALGVPAEEVGFTLDLLEISLVKCQLGLFGYGPTRRIVKPAETLSPGLEKAIRESLLNDRLPCSSAWAIAEKFGLRKMEVSSGCETLGIKIGPCQLGTFK
ncbi:MAG: hypothetical protein JW836_08410 [Deltaproteobacteria bacterium]|nr:hypothetical protein [Deltaproteobacteria bacterium]